MVNFYLKLSLVLVLSSFFCLKAAQANDDLPELGTGLEEDDLLFQEIPSVYSASKYEQKITQAPSSVSILTANEIKKYGYRTVGEALASLRGFFHTNDRNYTYLGVRGFGLPSDYNTRVLLMIDGHRFNDNIYDSFDTGPQFPVDIDDIKRIEVVRGPSSSLYGSSAFFGAINVITRRGRDIKGVGVSGEYGSFDRYKGRLSYGDRFESGLEAFVSGSYLQNQGNHNLYYREFDDPATNNGISKNNDEAEIENVFATVSYDDFTLQGAYNSIDKAIPTGSFETIFNSSRTYTNDKTAYLDLKYDHDFDLQTNVLARVSYNYYGYNGDYAYDYSEDDDPFVVINKDRARGEWVRAELQFSKTLFNDHYVTLGGEYLKNIKQKQNNYDLEVYFEDRRDLSQWALFLQDEYTVFDNLVLNVGVRYDYFDEFGDTINPRAALVYNPFEQTTLKLLYGEAFRKPNAYEAYYHDGGNTSVPSENLQPETIATLELSLEHYFTPQLLGLVTVFHNTIDDVITLTSRDDGFLININGKRVKTIGAETELEGKWENGFQGRLSYSFQNTETASTGVRLSNSPAHMTKLNLIAPVFTDKLFAGLELRYMSARKSIQDKVNDHFLVNLTLFSHNVLPGLETSASVYNVFNQNYFDPGSVEHIQNGIQQDGRTFRVKVNYEF